MDILSGFPTTKDKYKHVLLVVDSYSKWCEVFPLQTQEATEIADILYKEIITRYGAPRVLISDRGRNFMSNLVKALSEMFQITRHLTSSYHPQTNVSVERINSVIIQALRAYTKNQQDDWINLLPWNMMAYHATPATQSTFTPFFMLFGREMRTNRYLFDTEISYITRPSNFLKPNPPELRNFKKDCVKEYGASSTEIQTSVW